MTSIHPRCYADAYNFYLVFGDAPPIAFPIHSMQKALPFLRDRTYAPAPAPRATPTKSRHAETVLRRLGMIG